MTKDEALKLALEALEALHDENMDYLTRNKLGGENNQCMVFAREAITAIKEALAQTEQGQFALKHRIAELEGAVIGLQAQRTWVGLTDEEIAEVAVKTQDGISPRDDTLRFAIAIEAALKAKNT